MLDFHKSLRRLFICPRRTINKHKLRHKFHQIKKCPSRELADLLLKRSEYIKQKFSFSFLSSYANRINRV